MFFPWFFLCPNLPPPVIGLDPPFDDLIELNSVFGSLISESHPLEVGVGKHSRIGREWGLHGSVLSWGPSKLEVSGVAQASTLKDCCSLPRGPRPFGGSEPCF